MGRGGGQEKKRKKTITNNLSDLMLPSNYMIPSYDMLSNLQPIQTHMLTTNSRNTLLLGHLPVLNRRLPVLYDNPPLCSQVYVNFSDFIYC